MTTDEGSGPGEDSGAGARAGAGPDAGAGSRPRAGPGPEPGAGPRPHAAPGSGPGASAVVREVLIRAPAARVYEFFVDPASLVRWLGIRALLEPQVGGVFRFEVAPGEFCSGRYLELIPARRVVFTWGWESGALPVPPGSSKVEVDLEERDGVTLVRLTHSGLDEAMRPWHGEGWERFLARLAAVAEGRDPGPDPAAAGPPDLSRPPR